MKRAKKWPPTRVVEVSWFDANARGSWGTVEEYMHHTSAPCLSVGYLLKQDNKEVILVQSVATDHDTCTDAIAIPRGWIAKIRTLRK